MKNIYLFLSTIIFAFSANAQINSFPYTEGFESGAGGWVTNGSNSSWAMGTPSGSFVFGDAACGNTSWVTNLSGDHNNNELSYLESPTFDFSGLGSDPQLLFSHIYKTESCCDEGWVEISTDTGSTWTKLGTFGTGTNWYNDGGNDWWDGTFGVAGEWRSAGNTLTGAAGNTGVKIRFVLSTDGSVTEEGFGVDNILIYEDFVNASPTALVSPVSDCGLGGAETVTVTINNLGTDTIDTITVCYAVNGGSAVCETLFPSIAPGSSADYSFVATADLSIAGDYDFEIYTQLSGDQFTCDDTLSETVTHAQIVSTFPYFEDFESGQGGWENGGNNTWGFGTPAKNTIVGAASGSNAWVTGGLSTTNYQNGENSYVERGCFDFTNLPDNPWVAVKVWWESENSFDGTVLQFSTDTGATWQRVGDSGDPNNWFNDNTINGNPGGQQHGWTGANGGGSNGWVLAKHPLDTSLLKGEPFVMFRFAFGSDGSAVDDGFAFDDFGINDLADVDLGPDNSYCTGSVLDPGLDVTGTYAWTNLAGDPLGSGATLDLINGGVADSIVTIILNYTDPIGLCPDPDTITVTIFPGLSVSIPASNDPNCNGGSDGDATASSAGGTTPYMYLWSNADTTATITGLAAGTYTVTVTDANGCSGVDSVTLTDPALLGVTLGSNDVSCNGLTDGDATATPSNGTTPYTYSWSNGGTTATVTGLAAGTYTVTVTDQNGCTASGNVSVSQPTTLIASASVDNNVSCNGLSDGGATASATGGTTAYTYTWSNGGTTASITGLAGGTYSVTITDANGCTDSSQVTITEPTAITVTASVDNHVSCNGLSDGGASVVVSGGTTPYTYSWSNGGTTNAISGLMPGAYTVTITDQSGCTGTDNVTITEPVLLTASTVLDSNVSCNGFSDGGVTASGSGGTTPYTYSWSNGGTTASITGIAAGTYTITITDQNGCTATDNISVSEPTALSITTGTVQAVSCNGFSDGGATTITTGGTTPYNYLWSNSATTSSINTQTAGTYTVTVTDNNGCTDTVSAVITEPAVLVAVVDSVTHVSCNGGATGEIVIQPTGGTSPYNYNWSNGGSTSTISGLTAGTYTVTVTDNNFCNATETITITEPTAISLTFTPSDYNGLNISCAGSNDGSIDLGVSGGTPGYTYFWTGPGAFVSTDQDINSLFVGTYTVIVTDTNGCMTADSISLTEPLGITIIADSIHDPFCNGDTNGFIAVSSLGGIPGYNYLWNDGTTGDSLMNAGVGTYLVTVTDANGCTAVDSFNVAQAAALAVTLAGTDITCEGGDDGEIVATATGGTSPYGYTWNSGQLTSTISNLVAGTYAVTVTDSNGCTIEDSLTLIELNPLPVVNLGNDTTTQNGDPLVLDAGAFSQYMWSDGSTGQTFTATESGIYWVQVTDANGCVGSDTIEVDIWPEGISAPSAPYSIQYFPNPTDGLLNVRINGNIESTVTLTVLNLAGQTMSSFHLNNVVDGYRTELDLSDLSQGFYFIRLETRTHQSVSRISIK